MGSLKDGSKSRLKWAGGQCDIFHFDTTDDSEVHFTITDYNDEISCLDFIRKQRDKPDDTVRIWVRTEWLDKIREAFGTPDAAEESDEVEGKDLEQLTKEVEALKIDFESTGLLDKLEATREIRWAHGAVVNAIEKTLRVSAEADVVRAILACERYIDSLRGAKSTQKIRGYKERLRDLQKQLAAEQDESD